MEQKPQTWHYGVMAQYWAEFHIDGHEIAYFQRFIERYGQPALDVGCGTGRLLLPFLRAGLDVDGCDISPDMLAYCREKAELEGFSPRLYPQAMHELSLPRAYRTIFVCGSFGIGGYRRHDALALQRFYQQLVPGGVLVFDHQMPYGDGSWYWKDWLKENRALMDPDFWTEPSSDIASDGSEFRLRSRVDDIDPLEQTITRRIWVQRWIDDRLVAEEIHTLKSNIYFKNELVLLLQQAGFEDVTVLGDYTDAEANPEHGTLVFVAQKRR